MDAILTDHTTAPIDEKLRATLTFLEKLTLRPAEVTALDLEPVRAAGVSDIALEEAIYVCFLFNVIDRIADTLDFPLSDARGLPWVARILFHAGYGGASVPG